MDKIREEFERYMCEEHQCLVCDFVRKPRDADRYILPTMQRDWETWQAARASQRQVVPAQDDRNRGLEDLCIAYTSVKEDCRKIMTHADVVGYKAPKQAQDWDLSADAGAASADPLHNALDGAIKGLGQ